MLSVVVDQISAPEKPSGIVTITIPGTDKLLTSDDLGISAGVYLAQLINTPKGDDRSADVFSCACEMARQGFSYEQVLGILLNPDNAISKHCLAQKDSRRAAERAASKAFKQESVIVRQIQREQNRKIGEGPTEIPTAEITSVEEMLTRFVFIADGSQVADKERPLSRLSFPDFRNSTAASTQTITKPDSAPKKIPCAVAWLQSPSRLSAQTVTFRAGAGPMTEAPDTRAALNLFLPKQRSQAPIDWAERAKPFIEHIEWLWGDHANQLIDWLAHIEQKPGELPHFGWLHISKKHGKGRNWVASVAVRVWSGNVAASFDLIGALNNSFNDRLSRCLLAIVDEINEGGNSSYRHAQTLRQMITAEHREINPKYGRKHVEYNATRWLIMSNHVGALPLDGNDRRFFVVDHEGEPRDPEYYTRLYALIKDPTFISSVAEMLKQRDISNFNPGEIPPITKAKAALIASTRTEAETILLEVTGSWPVDVISWREISELIGQHAPGGSAVKYMTERAGLTKLKPRLRLRPHIPVPTSIYSLRNHEVWTKASKESLTKEISRVETEQKLAAFYGEFIDEDTSATRRAKTLKAWAEE